MMDKHKLSENQTRDDNHITVALLNVITHASLGAMFAICILSLNAVACHCRKAKRFVMIRGEELNAIAADRATVISGLVAGAYGVRDTLNATGRNTPRYSEGRDAINNVEEQAFTTRIAQERLDKPIGAMQR
ncbi:MAG: hypothetical protein KDA86_10955 [Planctomycetaceae bacterium]|nr:hypothetical protein [Planctomycetaceae bacterium]